MQDGRLLLIHDAEFCTKYFTGPPQPSPAVTREKVMSEKKFPLRVVLTVTTGRLLTESKGERNNGIGDLYQLLDHMTGDSAFTHQLGRFADECKPWLLQWFPELEMDAESLPHLDRLISEAPTDRTSSQINAWLAWAEARYSLKPTYSIGQIPHDDHERKHPYDELVAMRGTDDGIVVVKVEDSTDG